MLSRGARRSLALLIVAANAAVLIWLWLHDGGISGIHDSGTLLTSLGRITGLLGAYLLLLQVLLLARLRWLERAVGFDRLTVAHRWNGSLCMTFILAHVVLITAGYALLDHYSIGQEISSLWTLYPGIADATIGTALLILAVLTSFVIIRRRLRYEVWYLIHLTTYAAIALTWFHQLPDGNEFLLNPGAATYWAALYLITLALVILFRLSLPVFYAFLYQLRVAEVEREGPGVVSLRITGRHLDRMKARAGQFFLWRFLTRKLAWESHPFSLSAAPDSQSMRITVKSLGDFSSRIGEMKPGTRVIGEGPFGLFTDEVRKRTRVALIAGGVGITPIRALLEEMSGDIVLIYRVVSDDEIVFREEIEQLAHERGITVHYVTGSHLDPGAAWLLSPEHLRQLIPDIAKRDIYICGPPALSDLVEVNVRRAGAPRRHIHSEAFAFSPNTNRWKGFAFLPRRARWAILGAGAAVIALLGARFGWAATHSAAAPTATPVPTATALPTAKPAVTAPSAAATATPASASFTGTNVQTQYGPVQVTLMTRGKKITNVAVAISPQDPKSQSIEAQAIPILKQETLQAQSASVNIVSGATVVSDAYIQSLQSALGQAGI